MTKQLQKKPICDFCNALCHPCPNLRPQCKNRNEILIPAISFQIGIQNTNYLPKNKKPKGAFFKSSVDSEEDCAVENPKKQNERTSF